jgi:hypothetical protein
MITSAFETFCSEIGGGKETMGCVGKDLFVDE